MLFKIIKFPIDFVVTILLWVYFTLGFLIGFIPFFLWTLIRYPAPEEMFQKYIHWFFRIFFILIKMLTPGLRIHITDDVRSIRSSIIIANHLSYLDPLLFISIFKKQKTIVKNTFFYLPFFSWMLKKSGYIPSVAQGKGFPLVIKNVTSMKSHLEKGGNLFVFPEGTRSRDGNLSEFNKGVFGIAKQNGAPIKIVVIRNTNNLFAPGKFFFNTCISNTIEVELVTELQPDYNNDSFTLEELMATSRSLIQGKLKQKPHHPKTTINRN